jgi:hypothetical protein
VECVKYSRRVINITTQEILSIWWEMRYKWTTNQWSFTNRSSETILIKFPIPVITIINNQRGRSQSPLLAYFKSWGWLYYTLSPHNHFLGQNNKQRWLNL